MAARNPTSYTQWIDERKLVSGKAILNTTPDQVLDDQEFILDQSVLAVSISDFNQIPTTGSVPYVTVEKIYLRNKDMCDVSGVTNNEITCDVYVLARCRDSLVTGDIRFTSTAVASNTCTINVAAGSNFVWYTDTLNVKTNDIEDTITVDMRITNTNTVDNLEILAIAIIAQET